jgi:hypothetical protein
MRGMLKIITTISIPSFIVILLLYLEKVVFPYKLFFFAVNLSKTKLLEMKNRLANIYENNA